MASQKINNILDSKSKKYKNKQDKYLFLRHAANSNLDGGVPKSIKVGDIVSNRNPYTFDDLNQRTWLYPFLHEGSVSFGRRLCTAKAPGFGVSFLETFTGYFVKPTHMFESNMSKLMFEKWQKNIAQNCSFLSFVEKCFRELKTMGILCVFTDFIQLDENINTTAIFPVSYIIPIENVRNIKYLDNGDVDFIIWERHVDRVKEDYIIIERKQIVLFSTIEIIIIEENDTDWIIVSEDQNRLGIVPAVIVQSGSIVERPGTLDVAYMNMESVIDDVLTKTGLAIPYAPSGAMKAWPLNSDGTFRFSSDIICWVPEAETVPGFAAYPSTTTESHFIYLDHLLNIAFKLSGLKEASGNANASGIKEQWDFRKTEAILLDSKRVIIEALTKTAEFWGLWKGENIESSYTISDFDILGIMDELLAIQQSLVIDLGELGNTIERMKAFSIRNPNADEKTKSEVKKQIVNDEQSKTKQKVNPLLDVEADIGFEEQE